MANKVLLFLLCGGIFFGMMQGSAADDSSKDKKSKTASQKSQKSRKNVKSKKPQKDKKKGSDKAAQNISKKSLKALQTEQKLAAAAFDATKPSLTKAFVEKVMLQSVFDQLVGKEIPEDMKKIKKSSDTVTALGVGSVAFRLKVLMANPELPEATRIPLAWYRKLAAHVDSFRPLATAMDNAFSLRNPAAYAKARSAFMARQEQVKAFLETKPPRIDSKELQVIRKKNAIWRRQKFQAYQKKQLETFLNGGKEVKKTPQGSSGSAAPGTGREAAAE